MPTRTEVIAYARTTKGTPWHHQGRQPGVGIDCVGEILVIMWHFELTNIDFTKYPRLPNRTLLYQFVGELVRAGVGRPIVKEDRKPADVALLRIKENPQHFGWITDVGLLHAQYSSNKAQCKVIEHGMDAEMVRSIRQVYRINGITD